SKTQCGNRPTKKLRFICGRIRPRYHTLSRNVLNKRALSKTQTIPHAKPLPCLKAVITNHQTFNATQICSVERARIKIKTCFVMSLKEGFTRVFFRIKRYQQALIQAISVTQQ